MTENEKARELIATSETTVKVGPQNGWYLKRFAALQFEGSVDNFSTNMPIHVLEQQLPKEDTMKLDDAVIEGQEIDYSRFYDEKGNEYSSVSELVQTRLGLDDDDAIQEYNKENPSLPYIPYERLNKKYGALSVLNQIIPALTKELSSLFPKRFFVTNGKSTYDYRAAHGVSKDHWLDAYCIACSVLPNDTCDKTINSRVPYELKQFRRHDRRALNNENMSRVYTFNGKMVATNRHKATEQTTDSLEEFRQRQPNDVCNLKVKEHHPTYRNMNRNYPGSVFLVGNQVHVMQGIAGSKDGEATTYKDTNANSIAAGKCKFVAKNSGILFV